MPSTPRSAARKTAPKLAREDAKALKYRILQIATLEADIAAAAAVPADPTPRAAELVAAAEIVLRAAKDSRHATADGKDSLLDTLVTLAAEANDGRPVVIAGTAYCVSSGVVYVLADICMLAATVWPQELAEAVAARDELLARCGQAPAPAEAPKVEAEAPVEAPKVEAPAEPTPAEPVGPLQTIRSLIPLLSPAEEDALFAELMRRRSRRG